MKRFFLVWLVTACDLAVSGSTPYRAALFESNRHFISASDLFKRKPDII